MMATSHRHPSAPYASPPTAFDFQPASPLDTLVRRTSNRRNPNASTPRPPHVQIPSNHTPPRPQYQQQLAPNSPLIHSHFRSASNATASSKDYNSSFMDFDTAEAYADDVDEHNPRDAFAREDENRDSFDSSRTSHRYNYNSITPYTDLQQRFKYVQEDEEDVSSNSGSALRDSWQSGPIPQGYQPMGKRTISHSEQPRRGDDPDYYGAAAAATTSHPTPSTALFVSDGPTPLSPSIPSIPSEPSSPVPAVVVTSPDYPEYSPSMPGGGRPAGRAPIVRAVAAVSNFSRPVRASDMGLGHADSMYGDAAYRESTTTSTTPYYEQGDNQDHSSSGIVSRPRHASSSVPVLHPEILDPDAKRRVLERNLSRRARGESPIPSPSSSSSFQSTTTNAGPGSYGYGYTHSPSGTNSILSSSPHSNFTPAAGRSPRAMSSSPLSQTQFPTPSSLPSSSSSSPRSLSPQPQHGLSPQLYTPSSQASSSWSHSQEITLPGRPPSLRADSPVSLYSDAYSFYQLDSATPSPTTPRFNASGKGSSSSSPLAQQQTFPEQQPRVTISPATPSSQRTSPPSRSPSPSPSPDSLKSKAEHYLALGIKHHEANDLSTSASYFQKSATEEGGCGVGMLMWGLALRHGWGVRKDEKSGFGWVRKAAEGAVRDLEGIRRRIASGEGMGVGVGGGGSGSSLSVPDSGYEYGEKEKGAVKAELVLAIYEVGQCFFHGWGVQKDQKMGVSYYKVAAELGDPDAQNDLGFCLANGKGCKKDRKEAAKWYRAAVAQGHSDIGLAWIHKEKFQ